MNLGLVTEPRTHLVLRTGRLGLDKDKLFGSLSNADMEYVTIGGEYRYSEKFYESGAFVALGGYRLNGTRASGRDAREDTWGVSVGFTGELPIRRWLGVQAEISGHYVDFREEQFFIMGHVGVAFHFSGAERGGLARAPLQARGESARRAGSSQSVIPTHLRTTCPRTTR